MDKGMGNAETERQNQASSVLRLDAEKPSNRNLFEDKYQSLLLDIKQSGIQAKNKQSIETNLQQDFKDLLNILFRDTEKNTVGYFMQIKETYPDYQFEVHSLNTGILSSMIGKWLGLDLDAIYEVGIAGCLHDFGQLAISPSIMNKNGKLNKMEWNMVKKHPELSVALLAKTEWISPLMIVGIIEHHERLDGTGYPEGCIGGHISLFGRIIAMAGSFDSATTNYPYRSALNIFCAITELRDQSFGQLDAKITRLFYDKVLEYYVGRNYTLSNGIEGKVFLLANKPFIQNSMGSYDLSHKGIGIKLYPR